MTDNEIIWCFQNGMPLLEDDDVERADINKIIEALEDCCKELLPIIHKYKTGKNCENCKCGKGNSCSKNNNRICYYTINRPYYSKKSYL